MIRRAYDDSVIPAGSGTEMSDGIEASDRARRSRRVGRARRISAVEDPDSINTRAVAYANDILQGTTSPYDGAKALWNMHWPMRDLADALLVFIGLATEWEEHPDKRGQIEHEILVQADRLRARFGS